MATATEVAPADLTNLDFEPTCQIEQWYILIPTMKAPACGKPADYTATIHNFHTCAKVEKFLCEQCLPALAAPCATCHSTRVTDLRPIRG
jgi:hypothetical protein